MNSIRKTPLEDFYFSIGKLVAIMGIVLLFGGYFFKMVYVLNFVVNMAFFVSFAVCLFVLFKCLQYAGEKWASYLVAFLIGIFLIETMLSFLVMVTVTRDNGQFSYELSTRIYPIISSVISALYLTLSILLFLKNKRGGHFVFLAIAFLISAISGVVILLLTASIDVTLATNLERAKTYFINYLIGAFSGTLMLIALFYTFSKEKKLQQEQFISSLEEKTDYRIIDNLPKR